MTVYVRVGLHHTDHRLILALIYELHEMYTIRRSVEI